MHLFSRLKNNVKVDTFCPRACEDIFTLCWAKYDDFYMETFPTTDYTNNIDWNLNLCLIFF